jgi:hypothetical protein
MRELNLHEIDTIFGGAVGGDVSGNASGSTPAIELGGDNADVWTRILAASAAASDRAYG